MKLNKSLPINKIFFQKILFSSCVQLLCLVLIAFVAKNYYQNVQLNEISADLLISDSFTSEALSQYAILKNENAIELELYDLGNQRKLETTKFVKNLTDINLQNCKKYTKNTWLCKTSADEYTGVTAIHDQEGVLGYILAKKHYGDALSTPLAYDFSLILLTVIIGFMFNLLFSFFIMKKRIAGNTELLLEFISNGGLNKNFNDIDIEEYKKIAIEFVEERDKLRNLQEEKTYYDAIKTICVQVAHDIRSPLTALNVIIKEAQGVPEKQRIMIRNATQSINDIANNLLAHYQLEKYENLFAIEKKHSKPEIISLLLDALVSEKRSQYKSDDGDTSVTIKFNVSQEAYGLFSNIDSTWFKRIFSNLINNAIESIDKKGIVELSCFKQAKYICITIKDDGCGMSQETIDKILSGSFVSKKKNGHGIGLMSSKVKIEELGGSFDIHSVLGEGTIINTKLLMSKPAPWFASKLFFPEGGTVVLLDDDQPIHDVWQMRIANDVFDANSKIIHLYNPEELLNYDIDPLVKPVYLIDYELLGSKLNGLDVIEQLNLGDAATLVTSKYEDIDIQNRCLACGAKILPKNYAPHIPLNILFEKPDFILIDDSISLTDVWQFKAEQENKKMVAFNSIAEAERYIYRFDQQTIIYIDSDLGEMQRGEDYAKTLYEKGYKNLHLFTGFDPKDFKDKVPWVRSVVSKNDTTLLSAIYTHE